MCDFYSERCNALRHYSSVIMDLRKVTIVQGFVIITASFFLMKENLFNYSLYLALFGLLFTLILSFQLKNDMANFESFASQIRTDYEPKKHNDPWVRYYDERYDRFHGNSWYRFLVIYGPSTLIGITFIVILGISIIYKIDGQKTITQKQVVEIVVPRDVEVKIKK